MGVVEKITGVEMMQKRYQKRMAKGKPNLMDRLAKSALDDEVAFEKRFEEAESRKENAMKYVCRFFTDQLQLQTYLNDRQVRPEDIVSIQMAGDRDRGGVAAMPGGGMMILLTHVER